MRRERSSFGSNDDSWVKDTVCLKAGGKLVGQVFEESREGDAMVDGES